ncbi:MAG: anti-sigma factor family protein [Planctomycetota bacterium]|jgi:anti-sigma factor RsiW
MTGGRLSCDDARALMADSLDRGLEPEQRLILDVHLGRCDACSDLMTEQQRLDDLLATMEGPPPAAEFADRVIHALDRAPAARRPAAAPSPTRLRRALSSALALASVAVAAALLVPEAATASALDALVPVEGLAEVPTVTLDGVRESASARMRSMASFVPSGVAAGAAALGAIALVAQVLWFRSRSPGDSR